MLLEQTDGVMTSALARVEYASAVRAALAAGRSFDSAEFLDRFDRHAGSEHRITLLPLRPEPTLQLARDLVGEHRLRTLDAIHLAVAANDGRILAGSDELVFVTRDADQAAAAAALGLTVR